jgi:hypothetical protein
MCEILVLEMQPNQQQQSYITIGTAFFQSFFTQFYYDKSNSNNTMVLSLSPSALNTTYLGNKQLNETVPIVPINDTIPSNDTIPLPIPDPTPNPTPILPDPTPVPTASTYKLDNM